MPYIDAKFSTPMTAVQEEALKARLGAAIARIPGKDERWLMVGLQPNYTLYFRGDKNAPTAFVEVSVLGGENKDGFAAMTADVCDAFREVLGIPSDRVYVKYDWTTSWGWNGGNF